MFELYEANQRKEWNLPMENWRGRDVTLPIVRSQGSGPHYIYLEVSAAIPICKGVSCVKCARWQAILDT